jgi:hypothetical protein
MRRAARGRWSGENLLGEADAHTRSERPKRMQFDRLADALLVV